MKMDVLLASANGKAEITAIQKKMKENENGPKY